MKVLRPIQEVRDVISEQRHREHKIVLVPTMGNLHEGHLTLVRKARRVGTRSIVSIFVNPLQFAANEDLDLYPRTFSEDKQKLTEEGIDYLFVPGDAEMYPQQLGAQTQVLVPELSQILCGKSRPTHFQGVTTIVMKLINIVQPHIVILGEKDYQQLTLIKQMVSDLDIPVSVMSCQTVREQDGLAVSSRNRYLSQTERLRAPVLYETLCWVKSKLPTCEKNHETIEKEATERLVKYGFKPDYVSIRDSDTLSLPDASTKNLIVLAAAYLGSTRLIDNLRI